VDPRTEATAEVRGSLLNRFVVDNVAVVHFPHPPLVDQEVGMADYLGEGEEGLGDGDVAPDRLGQLVAAAGLLGNQLVDLLLAALVLGDPVVDQGNVVDYRLAAAVAYGADDEQHPLS
jgi:hypothetical protein